MMKLIAVSLLTCVVLLPDISFGLNDKQTDGDCSPIITGEVKAPIKIECAGSTIPLAAIAKLESYLQENFRSQKNLNDLIDSYKQKIQDWENRYQELEKSIQQSRLAEPGSEKLEQADKLVKQGDFSQATKLLQELAVEQEQAAQVQLNRAAEYYFQAAKAEQLDFKPWEALSLFGKAYQYFPGNFDYAFNYALATQEQEDWTKAEQTYRRLLDDLKTGKISDTKNEAKKYTILTNLALVVSKDNHQQDEAEQLFNEVLEHYQKLAKDDPQNHLPDVALILNNLANLVKKGTQRRSEAEKLYDEALGIRKQLAKNDPQTYLPDVIMTLQNFAALIDVDPLRHDEAEKLFNEALGDARKLAEDKPQAYLPYVATILNNLATLVNKDELRHSEAEKLYNEALNIRKQLSEENLQIHLPHIAMIKNNLANLIMQNEHRQTEAEKLYNEAVDINKQLAKENPRIYLPDVAATLSNLATLVKNNPLRNAEAEKLYNEAVDINKQLAKENPQVYLPAVAKTLHNMALFITDDLQRKTEAEKLFTEAIADYRELAEDDPHVYLPYLAKTLGALGVAYIKWEKSDEAFPLLVEATDIYSPLAAELPNIFGKEQQLLLLLSIKANLDDSGYKCKTLEEITQIDYDSETRETAREVVKTCTAETQP